MPKLMRIDDATEKIMLNPELDIVYPTLKGLKYEDRVRELVKFAALEALRKLQSKEIKASSESNAAMGTWLTLEHGALKKILLHHDFNESEYGPIEVLVREP